MKTFVLIIALVCSGCSYLLVDGPDPRYPETVATTDCTESKGWVLIDSLFATLHAASTMYALRLSDVDGNDPIWLDDYVIFNTSWFFIHSASAIIGNRRVERCRAAIHTQ